jgi:sarcosine oxidase subunit alpha
MALGGQSDLRFRGRPLDARPGDTLLAALARRGLPLLQRSIRYHRPRAPYCGVGACTGCLVRVNGVPNVRACRYVPQPGDRVETENAWPSPQYDVLGALDLLFFRGLDTLHGFRRPRFAAPIFHRVVRRLAGYGRLPEAPVAAPSAPGERIATDALVIGGGRSGSEAARRLALEGVSTVVVDRSPDRPPVDGVRWMAGATVAFLPPPVPELERPFRAIATPVQGAGFTVEARTVIVAAGGYDGPLLFPGNDRPGVLTADGAEALARSPEPPPFRRALLFGGGRRAAGLLVRFADHIELVAAPGTVRGEIAERAAPLEIPVLPRTLLQGAVGRGRVRAARLQTRGGGGASTVAVDAIVLAHRRLPNPQLFYQAGAKMEWRREGGAYFPSLSASGATSVPGLFAAGEAAGFFADADAIASGRLAAEAVIGPTERVTAPLVRVGLTEPSELEGYYRELLAGPRGGGKWVLCPCEDVLLTELEDAHRAGYRGIEVLKRMTSVGTGLCQGRHCLPDALLLLAQWENVSPAEVGYITQRPPVFPTSLGALAALPASEGDGESAP